MNAKPQSAAAMEKTRAQALKELRGLLSEVLSTAVAAKDVPAALKGMRNWERLIALTESRFADAWKQRFATGPQKTKQEHALELLTDEEHDQAILSEVFVNEVMEENKEPLDDLERQLTAMSGVAPDETRENPLGPHAWAAGIRSGVRELPCSPDDRDWLMEQVMPVLADRVAQFYSAMSEQITAVGFPGSRRVRGQGQPAKKVAAPVEAAPPPAGGFNPEQVEHRQPSALGGGGGGGSGEDFNHLLGMLSAQRATGDAGGFGGDGSEASAQPSGPAWSQDDILSVLTMLQKKPGIAPGATDGASLAANLKQAIGATASRMGLGGGVQSMPGEAQDTMALVTMLFEALLDGHRLDETALAELSKLVIPYVRVSMLDRHEFMLSTHPARRVLNLLVEALETAAPDAKAYQPLREHAFRAISIIVNEFADDLSLFEQLEEALGTEIQACRRRAELAEKRANEAQNGRERREHARDTVANFLSKELFGKLIPTALLDFLVGPWQHHHNLELLNEGDHSAEVMSNEQLLRELLAASEKGATLDPAQYVPRIADVLQSSGQPADSATQLVQQLSAAFVAGAKAPKAPAPSAAAPTESPIDVALKAAVPEWKPLKEVAAAAVDTGPPAPVDLVEKYTEAGLGTWIDLVDAEGKITSVKFSWTSPISGKRILSNRRGQRVLVASPEELAAMELDGRIKPRVSETAVEQALHTVARKLESSTQVAAAA